MNIAYLIAAHKNPKQLVRLIQRLNTAENSFFVHVDKKSGNEFVEILKREFSSHPRFFYLTRKNVRWAGKQLFNVMLDGFRHIQTEKIKFDFAFVLSGQDYPIKSNEQISYTLEPFRGKQFIEYFALPSPQWSLGGMYRIEKYYFQLGNPIIEYPPFHPESRKYAYLKPLIDRLPKLSRQIPCNFRPYGGGTWIGLSPEGVNYINQFVSTSEGERVRRFFEHTYCPDELFFQTIFMNSPLKETVINDHLRFIDWSKRGPNPSILTLDHFEAIQQTDKLFARKFDVNIDTLLMDRIDSEVLSMQAS